MNRSPDSPNTVHEFLTPEAMLTPGVAGSLTMMITNALTFNFAMPRAWVGLVLSFIFGLLVLVSARQLLTKLVFYVLNSLVIFCVAVGANGLGINRSQQSQQSRFPLISQAFAGDANLDSGTPGTLEYCSDLSSKIKAAQEKNASSDTILNIIKPCQNLSKDILQNKSSADIQIGVPNNGPASSSFFAPWKF